MDLFDLQNINTQLRKGTKVSQIDTDTILSTYQGHTIFSIYFDKIDIFEQIEGQIRAMQLEDEETITGLITENKFKRRMFKILTLPTSDLMQSKSDASQQDTISCLFAWLNGFGEKKMKFGSVGFKPIVNKSIHFTNTRFRDALISIALCCSEGSISSFVDNIDDIKALFNQMSTPVTEILNRGFNDTIYCNRVKHAEWKAKTSGLFGSESSQLEVFNLNSSLLTENEANKNVKIK